MFNPIDWVGDAVLMGIESLGQHFSGKKHQRDDKVTDSIKVSWSVNPGYLTTIPTYLTFQKIQRNWIDAIAKSSWLRTIGEHMTKMRITCATLHLNTTHKKTIILSFFNWSLIHWRVKAGPARSGVKLCLRIKQRRSATYTMVNSSVPRIIEGARKCGFGAMFSGHTKLLRGQYLSPFVVRFNYFFQLISLSLKLFLFKISKISFSLTRLLHSYT